MSQETEPVTVCIARRVKPGREDEFEQWLQGIILAATQFEGHQGVNILRPSSRASREYVYIFRFDTYQHLKAWEESDVCQQWLARSKGLVEGEAKKHVTTGLEYWFTLPDNPKVAPPPRYKMAIITFLAIYPLSIIIMSLIGPWLVSLPFFARGLIVAVLLVGLMTYAIMPFMTRLFVRWLYPEMDRE